MTTMICRCGSTIESDDWVAIAYWRDMHIICLTTRDNATEDLECVRDRAYRGLSEIGQIMKIIREGK